MVSVGNYIFLQSGQSNSFSLCLKYISISIASEHYVTSSSMNEKPFISTSSSRPYWKFLYPSFSHTYIKDAKAIDEYLKASISQCINAVKIHSFACMMMSLKSWVGLARNSKSFRQSVHTGTNVFHQRNSKIAFSHLTISLGSNVKQVSAMAASKEKWSISCLSSTYQGQCYTMYYNTLTASLNAAQPISYSASLDEVILDKKTSTQQQAFYTVMILK